MPWSGPPSSCARWGGAQVAAPRLDDYPAPIQHPRLNLRVSRANQVLGTDFTSEQMLHLLRRLHLPALAVDGENLVLQVPSFRGDLEREVDLIEEIARLAGFDAIPVTLPRGEVATPRPGPEVRLLAAARQLLLGLGFFEVITYAFQSERLGSLVTAAEAAGGAAPGQSLERRAGHDAHLPHPGLLDTLRRNTLQQVQDVRLFEISKVFAPRARRGPAPGGALARRADVRRPGGGFLEHLPGGGGFLRPQGGGGDPAGGPADSRGEF